MGTIKEEEYILSRRENQEKFTEEISDKLVIKRKELLKQKALKSRVKLSADSYTYLQYLPLIYKWATKSKGITRSELETLIYLKPIMVFRYYEFKAALKQLGYTSNSMFFKLKKHGWIKVYSINEKYKYYSLSSKASRLVTQIYTLTLLETPLPLDFRCNALVERYESKQDKVMMAALLEFNRKVRENMEK